ncbi:MAG: DUF3313 family protein [Gemmatimonadota bacterium]|jgi:hypothetical protein
MSAFTRLLSTIAAAAALTACASNPPPEPTLQTGPDAEVTVDGLVRVDNARVQLAYMKPGADLTPYTRFMLDPVVVAYKRDPGNRRQASPGAPQENFALSQSQMENFRSEFQQAVVDALTRDDGYELVNEPGPDVLRIAAELVDLEVRVPTARTGRGRTYARSYGEVTLVLELRDSQSGEIFVRAAERRDPTRDTNVYLAEVSTTAVRADTRRMFQHWADLLRERLDALREGA